MPNEAKHTNLSRRIMPTDLAPWTGMKRDHIYLTVFPEAHPDPLWDVCICGPDREKLAALYMAAPDLLEACKAAKALFLSKFNKETWDAEIDSAFDLAEAALSKATEASK